jgi:serine/threonine protein kinase
MSGKETLKIIDRFVLKHKLGQGTFSKLTNSKINVTIFPGYIYEAYDKQLQKDVALKVEKKDKNKTILLFEYNVLLNLKGKILLSLNLLIGLKHVAGVYDFV